MTLSPQVFNFRKNVLNQLSYDKNYAPQMLQTWNTACKKGILSEPENLNEETLEFVNKMDIPGNFLMELTTHKRSLYTMTLVTSLKKRILTVSPTRSWVVGHTWMKATAVEKKAKALIPVGINGIKQMTAIEDVRLYTNTFRRVFEWLAQHAEAFLSVECLSGDFNKVVEKLLVEDIGVREVDIFRTRKFRTLEIFSKYAELADLAAYVFEWKEAGLRSFKNYMSDNKINLIKEIPNYAHKYGVLRGLPGIDFFPCHSTDEDLILRCKEYYMLHGHPALVVILDDSISRYGYTARSIANQLMPYATVVVIGAMFEF
jgi:hypothetical protein